MRSPRPGKDNIAKLRQCAGGSKPKEPERGYTGAPPLQIPAMQTIEQRLQHVRQRLADSAHSCRRNPQEIRLLAVSKTRPIEDIYQAIAAGQRDFGENYLQDAIPKIKALGQENLHWHFIGPVQSNKTRDIAHYFDWVHSLDRIKIAKRLNEQRKTATHPLNICLQVNIDGQSTKAGFTAEELPTAADLVTSLPNLRLRGLMCIPTPSTDLLQQRAAFAALRRLLVQLQRQHPQLDTLSMGMSADMESAIREGATIVRIGTDIFGPRPDKSRANT